MTKNIAVVVPTFNGGVVWEKCAAAIHSSDLEVSKVLVIDSSSTDNSVEIAKKSGFDVLVIPQTEFNHGSTRQRALEMLKNRDIIVYMTHDAILEKADSLSRLVAVFSDEKVGVAYGRQLPKPNSTPIEAHARVFNYPEQSEFRDATSIPVRGIKAAFTSDSFAAYSVKHLLSVGGFPYTIGSEDMLVAAKMLEQDLRVAYVADATVAHSHNYSLKQEFERYFDIGVMHSENPWLLDELGKPEGEGLRFIKSEMAYLAKNSPISIPSAVIRTFSKYAGYKLGLNHLKLSSDACRSLSMTKGYWK
jgi:rhamnosyltransferase